ncbi:hypothetical protein [Gynuella sp.]|uniref:hypothetical protein n=1 Tax=Gynuella sp. TaxID=2969146 RepID=UPI003D0BA487
MGRSVSKQQTSSVPKVKKTIHKARKSPRPRTQLQPLSSAPRTSSRLQKKRQREMDNLSAQAGTIPSGHSNVDVTPSFMRPLDPGADGRGYVSSQARSEIRKRVKQSEVTVSSLSDARLPTELATMYQRAQNSSSGTFQVTNRGRKDGFRSGRDLTITVNQGKNSFTRTPSDTPRPRSPHPRDTGEELPGSRYEQAHQDPFQFTGLPGHTVHAPTQGNQVVDTFHEQQASKKTGGFVFRHDTYEASTLFSAQPTSKGGWQVLQSSYKRRNVASKTTSNH